MLGSPEIVLSESLFILRVFVVFIFILIAIYKPL